MPRFVILEHDHPELHWDFMLEAGDVLHTWRLTRAPADPGCAIPALALADHRLLYLDYEGPVSGGRGTVRRWDAGDYVEVFAAPSSMRVMVLRGARVQGQIRLEYIDGSAWSFRVLSQE